MGGYLRSHGVHAGIENIKHRCSTQAPPSPEQCVLLLHPYGPPSYRRGRVPRPAEALPLPVLVGLSCKRLGLSGQRQACSSPWMMAVRGNLNGSVSPRSSSGAVAASALSPSYMRCVVGFLQRRVAPKNSCSCVGTARGGNAGVCLSSVIK